MRSRYAKMISSLNNKRKMSGRDSILESLEQRLLFAAGYYPLSVIDFDWQGQTLKAVANEWVVQFSDTDVKTDALAGSLSAWGFNDAEIENLGGGFGLLSSLRATFDDISLWVEYCSEVIYIEPNFVLESTSTLDTVMPNDPRMGSLWGMQNTGQSGGTAGADIDAAAAWALETGSSDVVVAIIDTGVDYTHGDLAANMWINPGEIAGDGIDNDGNGYIDDVYGWDFANNDSDPMDDNGHGTHVAGTIGAVGDNATGIAGVNWDISIMALKFLTASGSGSTAGAVYALNYVTMMKTQYGINIVATNNSWGGGGYSTSLKTAIENAGNAGVLFIAAAGNETNNNDASASYPASYDLDCIISVAATDDNDRLASFSNWGAATVDLSAPGVSIYSTYLGDRYATMSGTSMATPMVTGTVALLAAYNPQASSVQIKQAILGGADSISSMAGKCVTGGRLNAYNSLVLLGEGEGVVDQAGPRVNSVTPTGLVANARVIDIQFNEDIATDSLSGSMFLSDGSTVLSTGDFSVSQPTSSTVRITLAHDLSAGGYTLTLKGTGGSVITDTSGNALYDGSDYTHNFAVAEASNGDESNDYISGAINSGLGSAGSVSFGGVIGDGANLARDIDIYRLTSDGEMRLEVSVLAVDDSLDPAIRVFDADGSEITFNIDYSGDNSFVSVVLSSAGTYYVGVSGAGNISYNPSSLSGRVNSSMGEYTITIGLSQENEYTGPSIAPNDAGYTVIKDIFTFEDITSFGTSGFSAYSDDRSFLISSANLSGFDFDFYGSGVNSLYVSTNGTIGVNADYTGWQNTDLNTSPSQALVAVFWDDMIIDTAADVSWAIRGDGDNQRLIVQWTGARFYGYENSGDVTFQAIFYEADNSIRINYLDLDTATANSNGGSATVGLRNTSGDRLLVSKDSSSGNFVRTGNSIIIELIDGANPYPQPGEPSEPSLPADAISAHITGIDFRYDTLVPGDGGYIYVTLANNSGLLATGDISMSLYLSADTSLDAQDIILSTLTGYGLKINPDDTVTLRFKSMVPLNTPADSYYVIAQVDTTGLVDSQTTSTATAVSNGRLDVVWKFGDFAGRSNVKFYMVDGYMNLVQFSMSGDGWGQITLNENDIPDIEVNPSSDKASLNIRSTGYTLVGDITVNGSLKKINAGGAVLTGDVNVSGTSSYVRFAAVDAGEGVQQEINFNTASASADDDNTIKMSLGYVRDASINTNGLEIKKLYAVRWLDSDGDDLIAASSINTLKITGNRRYGVSGDFQADISLSSADSKGYSINKLSVAGAVVNSNLSAAGAIKKMDCDGWNGGSINATSIRSMKIDGNFGAKMHLSGEDRYTYTISRALITRNLTSSVWDVDGKLGRFVVLGENNAF